MGVAERNAHVLTESVHAHVPAEIHAPVGVNVARKNRKQVRFFCRNRLHCSSCSMLIEGEFTDIGIEAVCNYAKGYVDVSFDEKKAKEKDIIAVIKKLGYSVKND